MNLYVSELRAARASFPMNAYGSVFVRNRYRVLRQTGMTRPDARNSVVLLLMSAPGWTAR